MFWTFYSFLWLAGSAGRSKMTEKLSFWITTLLAHQIGSTSARTPSSRSDYQTLQVRKPASQQPGAGERRSVTADSSVSWWLVSCSRVSCFSVSCSVFRCRSGTANSWAISVGSASELWGTAVLPAAEPEAVQCHTKNTYLNITRKRIDNNLD